MASPRVYLVIGPYIVCAKQTEVTKRFLKLSSGQSIQSCDIQWSTRSLFILIQ